MDKESGIKIFPQIFPWNQRQWSQLTMHLGKLAHALLLAGPAGVGKSAFAEKLAQALLCANPSSLGELCLACKNCQLLQADNHPDLYRIKPQEEGKAIGIDQIRALGEFVALRPHTATRKVVLLSPAEAMNGNAMNGLLKVLEEPPIGSHLILISSQPERLAATVRSRCTRITFANPSAEEALTWLKTQPLTAGDPALLLGLANQAPLQALAWANDDFLGQRTQLMADLDALAEPGGDPIGCASRWKKIGTERCLFWLQRWVTDLISLAMSENAPNLFNVDARQQLQVYANRLNLKKLFDFFDVISRNKGLLGSSLDEGLLLEDSLIYWVRLARR